jgi:hypothetical protein
MLKIGDILEVKGTGDRCGSRIPATAVWTVVALDKIEGSNMYAVLARSDRPGVTGWLAGQVDAVGRPGYPPPPMRGDEAMLWRLEDIAREDHAERVAGEVR